MHQLLLPCGWDVMLKFARKYSSTPCSVASSWGLLKMLAMTNAVHQGATGATCSTRMSSALYLPEEEVWDPCHFILFHPDRREKPI